MEETEARSADARELPAASLLPVAVCVFLSGAGSLILEIVWSRLLKLVFGSTTLAITTILVAYMLGLGLGGLFGGRLVARVRNGVRAYGAMEVLVGLYALFVPWLLDLYPWLNRHVLASLAFWPAAFVRFLVVLVVLLLPTVMMGATLPVLVAALVREHGVLARRVGLLYGLNTLGAVAGVLTGTFVLFGAVGLRATNAIGALLDLLVGLVALAILAPSFGRATPPSRTAPFAVPATERWTPLLFSYGLVGFVALVFEVCWTRVLALVFGSSIYAFATMLAGFLAGIALGSLAARGRIDRVRAPVVAYAGAIALLGVTASGTLLAFGALPDLFLYLVARIGIDGRDLAGWTLAASFLAMLPTTFVLGALFPLAVRSISGPSGATDADRGEAAGTTVGDVYFVNTLGSAGGAFVAGFLLVPTLGTLRTTALGIALALALAGVLLMAVRPGRRSARRRVAAAAAGLGALWLGLSPPGWDEEALAEGVYYRPESRLDFGLPELALIGAAPDELLFFREGVNATVSVHRLGGGLASGGIAMRLNGKTDASLADMSTQILSGHLPLLFGPPARRVLVIGYASGVTTGAAWLHGPERIDVAEIEPAVIEGSRFFDDVNHRPLEKENVRLILDDGRTWLTTTDETYDVVVSEPSNPWITGCANLFTAEFFETVRGRLSPEGRLLQWIQLYGMEPDGLRSILAALSASFEHLYGFLAEGESADLLLVATNHPLAEADLPVWEELDAAVRDDLRRVANHSTAHLWSLMALAPADLGALAAEATVVNTDDSMTVELEAPWHVYDSTLETGELLRGRASGIAPVLEPILEAGREGGPVDLETLSELGIAYARERQLSRAAGIAMSAAEERGAETLGLVRRGYLLLERDGPVDEALALFDQAVALDPDAFFTRFERGRVRCQERRYEGGLEDLAVALARRPDHLQARYLRTKALGALGRFEEGRPEVVSLLATPLVESDPHLWAEAAYFAAQLGDVDRAIDEMQRFLALRPDSPREWSMLASFQQEAGNGAGERLAAANADRAEKNVVLQVHRAARWYESLGSMDEAIRTLEFLERMAPDYVPGREDLERLRGSGS